MVPQLWSGRKVLMVSLSAPRGLFSKTEMSHIYYKLHHQDFSPDQKWSTFWTFLFFSNLHHEDLSPNQNGKFVGHNVLLVLTFSFFEHHRGPRVLPLAFSDCLMYFFHFTYSGVATSKPSLELFSGPKNKKNFKRPYLIITFSTKRTFLQNTAELHVCLKWWLPVNEKWYLKR